MARGWPEIQTIFPFELYYCLPSTDASFLTLLLQQNEISIMINKVKSLLFFLLLLLFACTERADTPSETTASNQPNVLFIAVDDLRPELGCYGRSNIRSPHMDQLAAEGFLFERSYCNVATCGASRASLLTGLRPTPDRFLSYNVRVSEQAPHAITLPQHFRANGYRTVSLGKVFHHIDDAPQSWSKPAWHPRLDTKGKTGFRDYQLPENNALETPEGQRGPPYEMAEVSDTAYYDGKIANRAIRELGDLKKKGEPFFLAVGFIRPHLPFSAPTKYWDLYPEADIQLPANNTFPKTAPREAQHSFGELRKYHLIPPEGQLNDELALKLIRGYYASVSYVDAMVGRVLDELKRLALDDNTIVVLWGDHGWSLMEHGLWCKHSTFSVAMRTALLLKVPGQNPGQRIRALTEYVDLYPTLCDLTGLAQPDHLQGSSFSAVLEDVSRKGKGEIFCRWRKSDAIHDGRYLYTEWFTENEESVARMLYDHETDPEELNNIAESPGHQALVAGFHEKLLKQRQLDRKADQ
ncbi:MAG: sulfatase [Bacteroidota bacterium]